MSGIIHTGSFLDLPPEIYLQILSKLEWNELLVAQRVNKAFKTLIETSTIQYRILLGIAGYKDGPDSHPMPVAERLTTFRALQKAFSRLDFPTKSQVEMFGDTPTYELQGGVYLQGRHPPNALDQTIGVNAWSFHNPIMPHAWRLPDFKGPVRDFTLDPAQDLLVVIKGGQRGKPLSLHFLSLATGKIHPLAKGIQSLSKQNQNSDGGFVITICGDLVGLLWTDIYFFVCDWKSSKVYVEHAMGTTTGEIDDFFFLDHERIVLVSRESNPPELKVCRLDEDKPFKESVIAIYNLPLIEADVTLEAIQARSDPSPQREAPYISAPIFTTPPYSVCPEDRIIIFTMHMHGFEGHMTLQLIVRAETLMNIPEAAYIVNGPAIVTSTMWMNQTRLVYNLIPPEQWMCFCYGSRMVTFKEPREPLPGFRRPMDVHPTVLEFNPRLVAWADAGMTGTPWDPQDDQYMHKGSEAEWLQSIGTQNGFFGENWISDLPFITVSSEVHTYPVNGGESLVLMIDDQRLIVLKVGLILANREVSEAALQMNQEYQPGIRQYMDIYTS